MDEELVRRARAQLFGSWEMNWKADNFAHDIALPNSVGVPVGFFRSKRPSWKLPQRAGLFPCWKTAACSTRLMS
jgi:hypothetical protein